MKVKVKELKELLSQIMDGSINESWTGADSMPPKANNPLPEEQAAIIQPSAETQVADTELPVGDDKWRPGNLRELGMAMKQLAEHVPESQISFVWVKLKKVIDESLDNIDQAAMEPRVADISTQMNP